MIELLAPSSWQMTFGERATIEGILAQLRPRTAIEIGTAEGGSLERIAHYSGHVHSFDLVAPKFPAGRFGNVTFHTGDSHALLPQVLSELASEGSNVEFVLVDGDHSADGVERDVRDLLASDAVQRTVIVLHDTLNDHVREGLRRVDYTSQTKVVYADLDFIGGHLSYGGPFHHQLWGGLGLLVVDAGGEAITAPHRGNERFYEPIELVAPVRDALVLREESGQPVGPGRVAESIAARDDLEHARIEAATAQRWLRELQQSASWRLTAPLRAAKQRFRRRTSESAAP